MVALSPMSTANPTPVRVGMTGTLAGKAYSIIARVVMGSNNIDSCNRT